MSLRAWTVTCVVLVGLVAWSHAAPVSARQRGQQSRKDDQGERDQSRAADAEPQHVWVHYDYMVFPPTGFTDDNGFTYPNGLSMAPSKAGIDMVVDAFAAQGLTLHIDPIHNAIPGRRVIIPDYDPWWPTTQACVGSDAVGILALRRQ